jgi:hypothetical protein
MRLSHHLTVLSLFLAPAVLAVSTVSDDALADTSPALANVHVVMSREGRTDRYFSNQQLKLDIRGQGMCELDIELHERGRGRLLYTRRIRAALPHHYVSDYGLPAKGRPGDVNYYMVKVSPRPLHVRGGGGCLGRTFIHEVIVVNRGLIARVETPSPLHIAVVPAGPAHSGGSSTPAAPPPGGAPPPSNPPPQQGTLATVTVPGGSMEEGAGQQIQVDGTGTCTFDLNIRKTDGSFNQTYPITPARPLPTTAVNGLEFPMLAQGSYMASATGTAGCAGGPRINFKVTPQPVVNKDPNAPSWKRPSPGQTRKPTDVPDGSNVYFELSVPSALAAGNDQNSGCCELEFNYRDSTNAWQPNVDTGPVEYSELQTTAAMRSISYFTNGTHWRVRARGYKWQTEFPWSDWLEFVIYQY